MPLVVDATAIIALGAVEDIRLLQHYGRPVIIGSGIREIEAVRFQRQIDDGADAGWIQVANARAADVATLRGGTTSFEMGRGEAESIAIAYAMHPAPVTLLIDEGEAFRWLAEGITRPGNTRNWTLICLAQLLHGLEESGHIQSATEFMQRLIDEEHYNWAPFVIRFYEDWCRNTGHQSVRG